MNKVVKNASWIIICRIIQSLIALIINMLTARYLGPSNYGTIQYASSLVTFVIPIMQLGLNHVMVNEIVNNPTNEGTIVGTAITLSFLSSIACIIGVISFAMIANKGDYETIIVCCLYSIQLIFQATEIIQYWFQAKLKSKYFSVSSIFVYVVLSLYKTWLLITEKSVKWFAVSNSLDFLLMSIILMWIYNRIGGQKLNFSRIIAKRLFNSGKYYIISGLMITIFSQTDKVMIRLMLDEAATGFYSSAISCILLTNFVFSAIIDSSRPSIIQSKRDSDYLYEHKVSRLFSLVFYLAVAQCMLFFAFAHYIIVVLYGEQFIPAVNCLKIAAWFTVFSYMGGVRSVWILAEGKQRYLWIINLGGVVLNVLLNTILIPRIGITGAAIATVITQFFTNIIMCQIIKPMRHFNKIMLDGMNLKYIKESVNIILNRQHTK